MARGLLVLGVLLAALACAATAQGGCYIVPNANAEGEIVAYIYATKTIEDCCRNCRDSDWGTCDVFVYCNEKDGCDNGSGKIYPYQLCTLKYQGLKEGGFQEPTYYATGSSIPWTSGYIKD